MTTPLVITAADRCYVKPRVRPRGNEVWPPGLRSQPPGERVLLLGLITRPDPYQSLCAAACRLYAYRHGRYRLEEQGLVLPDDLPAEDRASVGAYAASNGLRVFARPNFIRDVFLPETYGRGTLAVSFHLPFDLSRLAETYRVGRGRYRGGFSLDLISDPWEPCIRIRTQDGTMCFVEFGTYIDKGYGRREAPGYGIFRGRFLSLKQWAYALDGIDGHTVASACPSFGIATNEPALLEADRPAPDVLDALQRRMDILWRLFEALRAEWDRWCPPCAPLPAPPPHLGAGFGESPDLDSDAVLPYRVHSPAGLAKALVGAAGIRPLLEVQPDLSKEILGAAMAAFKGGRAEGHILHTILQVIAYDLTATYPTLGVLLNLWPLVTAQRVEMRDVTTETQTFLDRVTIEDLLRPEVWPELVVLCRCYPEGAVIPEKAQYKVGGDYGLALNPTTAETGMARWLWLPDLVAAKLPGHAPRIDLALRPIVAEAQKGLCPVPLRQEFQLDPHDGFRSLLRARLEVKSRLTTSQTSEDIERAREYDRLNDLLKTVESSLGYGIFVEYNEEHRGAQVADVWTGDHHFTCPLVDPHTRRRLRPEEYPGKYFHPLVAGPITSSTRLLLTMMERMIRDADGTWALMDTDSVQIVATRDGGLVPCPDGPHRLPNGEPAIRALSFDQAETIRARFDSLAPFGGPLWKVEKENAPHPAATRDPQLKTLVLGTKRYVLFNDGDRGEILIRKVSEHALGHLLPPPGWTKDTTMEALWEAIIQFARGDKSAIEHLPFARRVAMGAHPISRPEHLRALRRAVPRRKGDNPKTLMPFGDMLIAYPRASLGEPEAFPVACYAPDPECTDARWVDLGTGRPVKVWWEREPDMFDDGLEVCTFAGIAYAHRRFIEARYLDARRQRHEQFVAGELQRRPVHIVRVVYLGKESSHLSETQLGLMGAEQSYTIYEGVPGPEYDDPLRAAARDIPLSWLAETTGMSERAIRYVRNGHVAPRRPQRAKLWAALERWGALHREGVMGFRVRS